MKQLITRCLAVTRSSRPESGCDGLTAGDWPASLDAFRPKRQVPAAVLLPLIERSNGLTVFFTVRSPALRHHAGQVSFPGGRRDPRDLDPTETALREAHEEVGLAPDQVEVAGYLPDYLTITGYAVTPVVGFVAPAFQPRLDQQEVSEAFEVPLDALFAPNSIRLRQRRFRGVTVPSYEMTWGRHLIWGATAAMLVNFRNAIGELWP